MLQKCMCKEQSDCIYLTKDNRDEVLKFLNETDDIESIEIVEDNDEEVAVLYKSGWSSYLYNHWYVMSAILGVTCYTDKEFKEMFELV